MCNGTNNQAFALYPNGELRVRDLCVAAASKTDGAKLRLERCTGSELQRWGVLTGYLGIGPLNASGFDSRTALCVLRGAKEGDHYPLALGSCSRAYGHEWDVTD